MLKLTGGSIDTFPPAEDTAPVRFKSCPFWLYVTAEASWVVKLPKVTNAVGVLLMLMLPTVVVALKLEATS